jgi:hypothetical protein
MQESGKKAEKEKRTSLYRKKKNIKGNLFAD